MTSNYSISQQNQFFWELDLLSLFVGALFATLFWLWLWPLLQQRQWQNLVQWNHLRLWLSPKVEQAYKIAVAEQTTYHHFNILDKKIPLADVFVSPKILAPPEPPSLEQIDLLNLSLLAQLWPALSANASMPPTPSCLP